MTNAEKFGCSTINDLRELATRLRAMDAGARAPIADLRRLGF